MLCLYEILDEVIGTLRTMHELWNQYSYLKSLHMCGGPMTNDSGSTLNSAVLLCTFTTLAVSLGKVAWSVTLQSKALVSNSSVFSLDG